MASTCTPPIARSRRARSPRATTGWTSSSRRSSGAVQHLFADNLVAWRLAAQHAHDFLRLFGPTINATFFRDARHVRRTDEVLALEEGMIRLGRLALPHVAGGA